jgi:hypothetical protein
MLSNKFGEWPPEPFVDRRRRFLHIEHCKWAIFLDCIGVDWTYQPKRERTQRDSIVVWKDKSGVICSRYKVTTTSWFSVDFDNVCSPTFYLKSFGLLFCVEELTSEMQLAAYRIARALGECVLIAPGPMWCKPRRTPPHTYPMWSTFGGDMIPKWCHWGMENGRAVLAGSLNRRTTFEQRVLDAYVVATHLR